MVVGIPKARTLTRRLRNESRESLYGRLGMRLRQGLRHGLLCQRTSFVNRSEYKTPSCELQDLRRGKRYPASRIGEGRSFRLGGAVLGKPRTLASPVFAMPFHSVLITARPLVRGFAMGFLVLCRVDSSESSTLRILLHPGSSQTTLSGAEIKALPLRTLSA